MHIFIQTLPSPAESFYSTERREVDRTVEGSDKKHEIKEVEFIESIPSEEEEVSSDDKASQYHYILCLAIERCILS